MAVSSPSQSRFRALEYFCVLYDIAVDQEDYNEYWCSVQAADKKSDRRLNRALEEVRHKDGRHRPSWARSEWRPDYGLLSMLGVECNLILQLQCGSDWVNGLASSSTLEPLIADPIVRSCGENQTVDGYWRLLLAAKRYRALLQKSASTPAAAALDGIGLALIRGVPMPAVGARGILADQLRTLRWLYLNEASACYMGYHSIACADDCLNYIKAETGGEGRTPHELVALFNKAQGYLHQHRHEDALERFLEVIDYIDHAGTDTRYFDSRNRNRFGWPEGKPLFDAYLREPSVLQAADALLNLQRSTDAREVLKLSLTEATPYQRARQSIIQARIANDLANGANNLPDFEWRKMSCADKRNIALQSLAVQSERLLIRGTRIARAVSKPHGVDK